MFLSDNKDIIGTLTVQHGLSPTPWTRSVALASNIPKRVEISDHPTTEVSAAQENDMNISPAVMYFVNDSVQEICDITTLSDETKQEICNMVYRDCTTGKIIDEK